MIKVNFILLEHVHEFLYWRNTSFIICGMNCDLLMETASLCSHSSISYPGIISKCTNIPLSSPMDFVVVVVENIFLQQG